MKKILSTFVGFIAARSRRYAFLPEAFIIAITLVVMYYGCATVTSIAVYRFNARNPFTSTIERIFPYPAIFINKESIPLSRIRLEVNARKVFISRQGLNSSDAAIQQFVTNQLINRTLYAEAANAHNIVVSDSDITKRMTDLYQKVGGEDQFRKFLQENYGSNITNAQFRVWTKELLYEAAVQYQILARVTISHILFSIPDNASPEQIAAAKQKALDVRAKISDVSQFGTFASQYSDDENSRDKGGSLGTTLRGSDKPVLSKDFEDAIFSLPLGQVSQPLRTPQGWHLVVVTKKEGTVNESLGEYTNELRSQARISILVSLK
jgi:hypothetical protein